MEDSKEMGEVYCPITFLNGTPTGDDNINGLFTEAYHSKSFGDLARSINIDAVKDETEDMNSETFGRWSYDVYNTEKYAMSDTIIGYLISNINDLVNNTLISYINKLLGANNKAVGTYLGADFLTFNIMQEVTMIVANCNFCFTREYSPLQLYIVNDAAMESVYSMCITKIFDRYIVDHVANAYRHGAIDTLFKAFYYECYEEEPKEIPTPQECYTFITGMMREILQKDLMNFRMALMAIARNVSVMVSTSPDYAQNIGNPNYSTRNLVENYPAIRKLVEENATFHEALSIMEGSDNGQERP